MNSTDARALKELYVKYVGEEPSAITEMPSSGSNRRYFRITGKQSLIGVLGNCLPENEAFIYLLNFAKSFLHKKKKVKE